MDLAHLQTFAALAEEKSFTAAAQRLGVAKSVCSRRIADLEAELGTQLVHRSTRSIELTDAGREFHQGCLDILERLDAVTASLRGAAGKVSGRLRLSVPVSYTEAVLAPRFEAFVAAYPDVELHLHLTDARSDLISQGFDAAVRIGRLGDSGLIARKIGTTIIRACAAPSYLAARGTPRTLDELSGHECLRYANATSGAEWVARVDGVEVRKRVPGRWTTNSGAFNRRLAIAGHGIAVLPDFIIGDAFETGELVPVLEDHIFATSDIHIVYPQKRNMPAALRALIEHLAS